MLEYETSYLLIALGFVIYVNLLVTVALWLIHRADRKRYLAYAIAAGLVETCRQFPDFLIGYYPTSVLLYQLSLLLQFTPSLLFFASLLHYTKTSLRVRRLLVVMPAVAFCLSGIVFQVEGIPAAGMVWYLYSLPLFFVNLGMLWVSASVGNGWSPARFLLTGTSFTLLVLRLWMSGLELGETFYLIIYMEYLVFPMMLAAMTLVESELTRQRVQLLLEQRTQAGEDLQFIVDNSDDIILIADEVGLVQTWSKQAASKFGYSAEHAIRKLHMDELFAQIKIDPAQTGTAEFQTKMEAQDGSWFKADVRTKTVAHRGHVYTIYVLKDVVEAI